MLTLDTITLFYLNLSSKPRDVTAIVADWGVKVNKLGTVSRSRSRSHGRTTPSLTIGSGSSHPTRPPSSTRSALHNTNVRIYKAGNTDEAMLSELEDEGILSEKDETQGVERNAAVNSPYKGKKRATNAVSYVIFRLSHSNSHWSSGACEGHRIESQTQHEGLK